MTNANWIYRRRSGWRIGKLVFGYERRDYRISLHPVLVWPSVWRDRKPEPLAPAPKIDPEAFARRAAEKAT